MSKAFYVYLSELRGEKHLPADLRKMKLCDLDRLLPNVTDKEKQTYAAYEAMMKQHPMWALKVPDLQKMMISKDLNHTGLAKIEMIEALNPTKKKRSTSSLTNQQKTSSLTNQQKKVIASLESEVASLTNQQTSSLTNDHQPRNNDQKKVTSSLTKVPPTSDNDHQPQKKVPSTSDNDHQPQKKVTSSLTNDHQPQKKVTSLIKVPPTSDNDHQPQKRVTSLKLPDHYVEMIKLYCKGSRTLKYDAVGCKLDVMAEEGLLTIMGVNLMY